MNKVRSFLFEKCVKDKYTNKFFYYFTMFGTGSCKLVYMHKDVWVTKHFVSYEKCLDFLNSREKDKQLSLELR